MDWFNANTGTGGDSAGSSGNWLGMANGLASLYGGFQGMRTANNINGAVAPALAQNSATTASQIAGLEAQIAQNRAQGQQMYDRSLADTTAANAGLQGNIGTMTANLNALSDPNSPYMQQARQGIERKDAAAGRRSQWGERETQLAGTLADYVGRYAPGLNNSITNAQQQITQNNQGLASLYSTANNPGDRNTMALIQMLQAQQAGATAQNGIGRQAANSATNNTTGLIQQGLGALGGGLGGLFRGNEGAAGGWGTSGMFDWNTDQGGIGALNSMTGMGSTDLFGYGQGYYDNANYGTTSSSGDPYSTDSYSLFDDSAW